MLKRGEVRGEVLLIWEIPKTRKSVDRRKGGKDTSSYVLLVVVCVFGGGAE